jgi:hypothetical protein
MRSVTHEYEDISDRSPYERKAIAKDRWESMPTVIREIFANAPKLAMYEALRKLGVDVSAKRSVEWAYKAHDGALVVTVWHDHIQMSPEGKVVYYIPIDRWRGIGSQVAKAEQLGADLDAHVGKTVKALLLRHEWNAQDTQFAKAVAIDLQSWRVEKLSEREFLLWRGKRT